MKTVIASGYFDPIHIGHIEYLKKARELGDWLIVILNNSKQSVLKYGKEFQPLDDRREILSDLKFVDEVHISIDEDASVCKTIESIALKCDSLIFAKGGDRFAGEIPERAVCEKYGIQIVDGLGKKMRNSSDLRNFKGKPWGFFEEVMRTPNCVLKILHINPGHAISLQYHKGRQEVWVVESGTALITRNNQEEYCEAGRHVTICPNEVHRAENKGREPLVIVEFQSGICSEDDIVRILDKYGRAK